MLSRPAVVDRARHQPRAAPATARSLTSATTQLKKIAADILAPRRRASTSR
ncbi:hypothetical protein QJS66_23610 (plasmid) [Kocuria rhizophila]|nr:hypothetical protein QJS66_23610 [Kocuria rhizophila]